MISRVFLFSLPLLLSAQEPPPDVDQELRARVNAFYQNFLEGSFSPRKGEPFVAEDTKDFYYNAAKQTYLAYRLGAIAYSDNFTKAVVIVIGKEEKRMAGQSMIAELPQETHWKIENGKWVWYHHAEDSCLTPMCGKTPPPPTAEERAAVLKPKDTSPEAVRSAGMAVLQQQPMGVDKPTVTMSADEAGSAQVVFTNGADGEIVIGVDGPAVKGLKRSLDRTTVPGHGKAVLTLQFDPSDKSGPLDAWVPKGNIPLRFVADPFNRIFPVTLQFVDSK
jgi:hypothetical protein